MGQNDAAGKKGANRMQQYRMTLQDTTMQPDKRIECRTKDAAGQNNKYGIKLFGKTNSLL